MPDTGDLEKIEAKLFAAEVFWVAVCFSVGSSRWCALLGNNYAFFTVVLGEVLKCYYRNIQNKQNRRVCDLLQLALLALDMIIFQVFSCAYSYLFTLLSIF